MKKQQPTLSRFFSAKPSETASGSGAASASKPPPRQNAFASKRNTASARTPARTISANIAWPPRGLPGGAGSVRSLHTDYSHTPKKRGGESSSLGSSQIAAGSEEYLEEQDILSAADVLADEHPPKRARFGAHALGAGANAGVLEQEAAEGSEPVAAAGLAAGVEGEESEEGEGEGDREGGGEGGGGGAVGKAGGSDNDPEGSAGAEGLGKVEPGGGASGPRGPLRASFVPPPSDPDKHAVFVDKLMARTDESGQLAERLYGRAPAAALPQGKEKYTPLEQQVVELKAKYPQVLLMVEVGYKYRFFGDDAEVAAKILGIYAHYDRNFLTASIPTFRLHFHVRRLVEAGHKVGVVRQTETAAIKAHGQNRAGPFGRQLSALYTRATLEAAEDLGGGGGGCHDDAEAKGRLSSYLMCITEAPLPQQPPPGKGGGAKTGGKASPGGGAAGEARGDGGRQDAGGNGRKGGAGEGSDGHDVEIGVVAVETATGDVIYGHFQDTVMRSQLESRLLTVGPAELLVAGPLSAHTEKLLTEYAGPTSSVRVERVSRERFRDGGALAEVASFYARCQPAGDDVDTPSTAAFRAGGGRAGAGDGASGSAVKHEAGEEGEEEEPRADQGLEAVMAMPDLVVQALALALQYLRQFGLQQVLRFGASFRPFAGDNEMSLSPNALRQLEVLRNSADGKERGSLLWLLDQTHTAFGGRLLRHWVAHPLRDEALINARLNAVAEIAESLTSSVAHPDGTFPASGRGGGYYGAASRGRPVAGKDGGAHADLAFVLTSLGHMPDVERGITRIFHRTATPAERLKSRLPSRLLGRLLAAASAPAVIKQALSMLAAVNAQAASAGDKCNLLICRDGRFPEVARCRAAIRAAKERLEGLLPALRKLLKNPSLRFCSVSGASFLIEVSSTKKMNRFHPPDVLAEYDRLALANEQLAAACARAWSAFLGEFADHYVDFRGAVQALAALDCLHALAIVSRNNGYVRPEFVDPAAPPQLVIKDGRHPVLEATLQEGFVPNDTWLRGEGERCQIITGPNMGGKSCYIRQVALIAIMAQVGSFVPATSAALHVLDAVHTRMGASDSLQRGRSTFLEELSEASDILRDATCRSLVILDELGRGTSTHDGVAIAFATLQYLLKETGCLTLFVTHYPKIAELRQEMPAHLGAYYMSYLAEEAPPPGPSQEPPLPAATDAAGAPGGGGSGQASEAGDDGGGNAAEEAAQSVTFLYKLVPGVASRSFGLHIPETAVARAAVMAGMLEHEVSARQQAHLAQVAAAVGCAQSDLPFAEAGAPPRSCCVKAEEGEAMDVSEEEQPRSSHGPGLAPPAGPPAPPPAPLADDGALAHEGAAAEEGRQQVALQRCNSSPSGRGGDGGQPSGDVPCDRVLSGNVGREGPSATGAGAAPAAEETKREVLLEEGGAVCPAEVQQEGRALLQALKTSLSSPDPSKSLELLLDAQRHLRRSRT
eukprot:jgi/Mesen1/4207/ME000219S03329